jgi:putative transposase
VRKRGVRKRSLGMLVPMAIPQEPNQRWYLHFVADSLACGQRFRMLNVIDDSGRECPGMHRRHLAVRSAGCSRIGRHR